MQNNKEYLKVADANSVIELAAVSLIGDRADQQDSFGYRLTENGGIVVVCDGMGGHHGGGLASAVTVDTVIKEFENSDELSVRRKLRCGTQKANARVCELKTETDDDLNPGSTLVAVAIKNKNLYWSSVGDSRAYLCRDGQFVQFTKDQNYGTVLNEQLNAGVIDQETYNAESNKKEALISYIGIGEEFLIDYNDSPLEVRKDDRIIVMSDGLFKLLSDEEMGKLLNNFKNIHDALHALEMKAQNKKVKNRDNMTVAMIKII